MKLINLGSGNYPLKNYKNIDINPSHNPDECYDIKEGIREVDDSVNEILLSHILMYFPYLEVKKILKDCYRVLVDNGGIRITEDNKHLKIRSDEQQKQYGKGQLFDRLEMNKFLREAGFVDIIDSDPFKETKQHLNLSKDYSLAEGRSAVYFLHGFKRKEKGMSFREPLPSKVWLGLDDFGEENNQLDILWRLRNYFDDFKVNLFIVPNNNLRWSWLAYLYNLEWIKLCIHGYNHLHFEELDEITLKILIDKRINYFEKIYKAPYWELSERMKQRLKKLGIRVIEEEEINWEIGVKPPKLPIIHGYGHIYPHDYKSKNNNSGSSLFLHYKNIMKLPKNTNFRFYERYY